MSWFLKSVFFCVFSFSILSVRLSFITALNCFILVSLICIHYHVQIDENVQREIINHRSLKHPNIIRFKEVSLDFDAVSPQ